jgi:hypothetical protein
MSTHHSFDIEHAQLYGLREAVLISNLHYWVSYNYANGTHQHDGRTWTYNSVNAFEALFPYLTYKQIRTSLETLITLDVLERGNYNKNPADRTSWFAFTDSFLANNPLPERANGPKKKPKPSAPEGKWTAREGTASAQEGESLIEPDVTPFETILSAAPTALPAKVEIQDITVKQKKSSKAKPDDEDTALQAACRATWSAYSDAYCARYGVEPTRNASVSSKVKQFVIRIGQDESPGVARFFVERVSEAFVVRGYHAIGTLLQNAEAYRTQWATGQAMTNTRAQQADKTQSNFDAAQGAKALLRARREQRDAE